MLDALQLHAMHTMIANVLRAQCTCATWKQLAAAAAIMHWRSNAAAAIALNLPSCTHSTNSPAAAAAAAPAAAVPTPLLAASLPVNPPTWA
jgi:hypothetical protein